MTESYKKGGYLKRSILTVFLFLAVCSTARGQTSVSANLTTAGTSTSFTTTSGLCLNLTGNMGGTVINLGGTWSGTMSFFASVEGNPLVALNVTPSNGTTAVTTATANGAWQANSAGYSQICAIFTTAT